MEKDHPIIHGKIRRAVDDGLTRGMVEDLYHGEGYSMEATIAAIPQLSTRHFTPRSFKVLCEVLGVELKEARTVSEHAASTYSRGSFAATLEAMEEQGVGRTWLEENYPTMSTNALVEEIQRRGITMYKGLLRRVLEHHGVQLRSGAETAALRHARGRATNVERYGVENPMQIEGMGERVKESLVRNLLVKEGSDPRELEGLSLDELLILSGGRFFGEVNRAPRMFTPGSSSALELDLMERFGALGWGRNVEYLVNNRSLIYPYEIDFYLPRFSLGVEISPPWTHCADAVRNPRIDPLYHHRKFSMARGVGVDLIQWFSEDMDGLWNVILSKICLGPSPAPLPMMAPSITVSADGGADLSLERAGFHLVEHLEPVRCWVLRTGTPCGENDGGALPLHGAGFLKYAQEHP